MARYLAPFRSGLHGGFDPFLSLHREMNRLFDDVMRVGSLAPAGAQSSGAGLPRRTSMSVRQKKKFA
jgi:HSP20 family protein